MSGFSSRSSLPVLAGLLQLHLFGLRWRKAIFSAFLHILHGVGEDGRRAGDGRRPVYHNRSFMIAIPAGNEYRYRQKAV